MTNFYPIKTDDGTLSLFNKDVNDIYHSKIGAYTEALKKFTLPSGIIDYVKIHNEVNILDVCYGLGYNSRVTVSEIWKHNPLCKVNLTCIEYDPKVLVYSMFAGFNEENMSCKDAFIQLITPLLKDLEDVNNNTFQIDDIVNTRSYTSSDIDKLVILHNIYYKSISHGNTYPEQIEYKNDLIHVKMHINDLRITIPNLSQSYDYIFYDAFTPAKVPSQWTVQIFKHLYSKLNNIGAFLTYANSVPVRNGLVKAGFYVGRTEPIGKKSSGTIAYKNNSLLQTPLSDYEQGLLKTKAGIPYRDKDICLSDDEIKKNRELEQKQSDLMSSTKFIKSFKE